MHFWAARLKKRKTEGEGREKENRRKRKGNRNVKKIVTWNVNGLRACLGKGFSEYFEKTDADLFCLQETKMSEGQAEVKTPRHTAFWNSAEKKGYSGTAVFAKEKPLSVAFGIGDTRFDAEGRVITLEYEGFYLVTAYVPNSQRELARLSFRMEWEEKIGEYLVSLDRKKPVIYCGDLNVAHEEIDLKNPKTNHLSAGFSDEEREGFSRLLALGFADVYRELYPERVEYTWWSYMFHAREKNAGWRIDYFVVSRRLLPLVSECRIRSDVFGSDHCPVELLIDL